MGKAYAEEATASIQRGERVLLACSSIAQAGRSEDPSEPYSVKPTKAALDRIGGRPQACKLPLSYGRALSAASWCPLSIGNKKKAVEEGAWR